MSEALPLEHEDNPVSQAAVARSLARVERLWARLRGRAPAEVQARVEERCAAARALGGRPVRERVAVAKGLEDLNAELRGLVPWEPAFYRDGRLGVTRAQDPIRIRGAIDQARIERFFERYLRRAEEAYARLEWFLERAGALDPNAQRAERKPWEQPYVSFDHYKELIWGRVKPTAAPTRRE